MKRIALAAAVLLSGCYHFVFEQTTIPDGRVATVTYRTHRPTWLNGFVGTGRVHTDELCPHPLRTELKVTAVDVLVSAATLLIYTPHTLEVTCEVEPRVTARAPAAPRF